MPTQSYPYNLLNGLSDFWTRFFADAPQLESLYRGTAYLMGQAYLDLLTNVLSLSLVDCPTLSKEYWKLITASEDQLTYIAGDVPANDRWALTAPDNIAKLSTLDNKIIEPTASLQLDIDFDFVDGQIRFKVDPTSPTGNGSPLPGFARRQTDVPVGGKFDVASRVSTFQSWVTGADVKKGDTLRLLHVSPAPDFNQSLIGDFEIVLVRDDGLYVSVDTPLPSTPTSGVIYTILRRSANADVTLEHFTFSGSPGSATLAHSRLVQGSVVVYGFNESGNPVQENVDYVVDYQKGIIHKLRVAAWVGYSPNNVSYSWLSTVWPVVNGPPPYDIDGTVSFPASTRVMQLAFWAPDVLVDRRLLANNFGSLIGSNEQSSEAYRAFLRGVFQLYILGPVLERFESALNVILGLPVIRTDGEVLVAYDTSSPSFNRVTTTRLDGTTGEYDFPKATPIRTDVVAPPTGGLTFMAFETLTTAVTVTDYIEDPTWWHNIVIPSELFGTTGGATVPDAPRRTVSPLYVENIINPIDGAQIGDPGLYIGADDEGHVVPAGHRVYRHRFAFVMMDRFFKAHMFYVTFADSVFVDTGVGVQFARNPDELRKLVQSAKPAHTYAYMQPSSFFEDFVILADDNSQYYQPQRYGGADPNASELYASPSSMPSQSQPYVQLGLFIAPNIATSLETLRLTDDTEVIGSRGWLIGDYFHYELFTDAVDFTGGTVTAGHVPAGPRRRRLVRVYIAGTNGGKRLIENVDYSVAYDTGIVTRLTTWDANAVNMTFIQLNIGNVANAPPTASLGDTVLLINSVDPALVHSLAPGYDPATSDDISCVERALTITVT